jgi:Family of unknown function (DUF5681)
MKFQPGQSGNPAGRPLGARNKKTIAMEEELAQRAEKAVGWIIHQAERGHAVAMRICAEWVKPGGTSRALALELPKVSCAADAQVALDMVIEAFGRGEITVREFPPMLGAVDRMARVAERIQQNREREHERYKAQRVHGVHPDMIPKPTGEPDRLDAIMAAVERGEDPFPDDPAKSAYVMNGEGLYPPVNFENEACGLATPEAGASDEVLYSPVNFNDGTTEEEPLEAASSDAVSEAAAVSGFPSPHAQRGGKGSGVGGDVRSEQKIVPPADAGDGASCSAASGRRIGEVDGLYFPVNSGAELSRGTEPDGDGVAAPVAEIATKALDSGAETICCSELPAPPTPDPSPPRFAWGEGNPEVAADIPEGGDGLYSPVNFGAEPSPGTEPAGLGLNPG